MKTAFKHCPVHYYCKLKHQLRTVVWWPCRCDTIYSNSTQTHVLYMPPCFVVITTPQKKHTSPFPLVLLCDLAADTGECHALGTSPKRSNVTRSKSVRLRLTKLHQNIQAALQIFPLIILYIDEELALRNLHNNLPIQARKHERFSIVLAFLRLSQWAIHYKDKETWKVCFCWQKNRCLPEECRDQSSETLLCAEFDIAVQTKDCS